MGADSYWARRSTEREEEWNKKSQETVEKELAAQYERSAQRIQANIEQLYGKFANDNGISIVEAKKLINGPEFRTWKKDVEEYMKEYKETGNPKTLLELNTLSMRSRISRLDKLYGDTLIEIDKLGQKINASITGFLKSAYKDNRLHSAYELAKRGQGPLGVSVDNKHVESVLRTPWSGKNYSTRIWDNSDKLSRTIQEVVVSNVHRGTSVEKLAKEVQERMNVSKNNAVRLVRTELNYVHNQATLDSLKSANMEYFQFIATIDKRTSSTCREHDNNIYPVADAEVGTNVPPLHPRCRSTIAGTLDKKTTSGSRTVKMAKANKNEPTRYEKVPRNMDYDNWKAIYIDKSKTFSEWRSEQKSIRQIASKVVKPKTETLTDMITKLDLSKATPQDIINVGKAAVEKHDIINLIGNKDELAKVISQYRDVGYKIPDGSWAPGSVKKNREMLQGAFNAYPRDWGHMLEENGKGISTRKVKRGYFVGEAAMTGRPSRYANIPNPENFITINMNGVRKTTPFHEIGHMVEYFSKYASRLSNEFIDMRTKGEVEEKLNDILNMRCYGREAAKKDNFITPYIGKTYKGGSTEVLSVGLESVFEPTENGQYKYWDYKNHKPVYATIKDDEEFLHFIIGMILTV